MHILGQKCHQIGGSDNDTDVVGNPDLTTATMLWCQKCADVCPDVSLPYFSWKATSCVGEVHVVRVVGTTHNRSAICIQCKKQVGGEYAGVTPAC